MLVLPDCANYWGRHLITQHACLTVMSFSPHVASTEGLLWEARGRSEAPQSFLANLLAFASTDRQNQTLLRSNG
jgi:hypothetical protein